MYLVYPYHHLDWKPQTNVFSFHEFSLFFSFVNCALGIISNRTLLNKDLLLHLFIRVLYFTS